MSVQHRTGSVLVVGGGIAGMQSALDLADAGFKVYLAERQSAIGGRMVQLDKTFPTNDCSMCTISPRLVQIGLHPNIEILTNTSVAAVTGTYPDLIATLKYHPRYIDSTLCKACGECQTVCPVSLDNEFDVGLSQKKAAFKQYPQATPNAFAIQKRGWAPCKSACPAHVNTQGYVALIRQEKFREALALIRRDLPFPSLCGRACARPCEAACAEGRHKDGSVAIRALKRFVADRQPLYDKIDLPAPAENPNPKRVAIVGAGPAGLSAAYFSALAGHRVTVFEALPAPGGMMRYGVPAYRLPRAIIQAEIDAILSLGITLKTGTTLGQDMDVAALFAEGMDAVFLACGLTRGRGLGVPGEDLAGVYQGVALLRDIAMCRAPELGKRVAVIGGGNVAVDVARSARRLGAASVAVICLEQSDEMPAHADEIEEALEEGITIDNGFGPTEVSKDGEGLLLQLRRCVTCYDKAGRFRPIYDDSVTKTMSADSIVLAVGQTADPALLAACGFPEGRITADSVTLATGVPGLFAGGDVISGPNTIIEAVAMGRRAAASMDAFFQGRQLDPAWPHPLPRVSAAPERRDTALRHREAQRPAAERIDDFSEITESLTPAEAVAEAARCLSCADCSECRQCEAVCEPGAVNHDERERIYDVRVGAVILAPGFDQFDVGLLGEYGFGRFPNVVSSLAMERMLSASGPTGGHIARPSDGKAPERIAWIQCVGSRDHRRDREYCSAVCCMFATKQSLIVKDHFPEMSATIFYMDMRAYGKGFDAYVEQAKERFGVRYCRAMISKVYALPESDNLEITYRREDGDLVTETFDLLVLSGGLSPAASVRTLADNAGVRLDRFGFAERDITRPNRTNRRGVYVAGVIEGPKDIPETVMSAASAAALAGSDLAAMRGADITEKVYPEEREVRDAPPRVGVFVCRCGVNIARVVDVPKLTEYAAGLGDVVLAEENLYTCSADTQQRIAEQIAAHGLNRVVVASCSPRTHEPLFQETLRNAGLNKYLFEMANIRDQCAWVHADNVPRANEKAKDLVRMAVGRARRLVPLPERRIPVTPAALVVGGGASGLSAALALADQGFEVALIEKAKQLGGNLRQLTALEDGRAPAELLDELCARAEGHRMIRIHKETTLVRTAGYIGNFLSTIATGEVTDEVRHGVTIIAVGGVPYVPTEEYGFGADPRIMTQSSLEARLDAGLGLPPEAPSAVAMIQCVGSRTGETPVCSRVCCTQAVKNALRLKAARPEMSVTIFYRDIRTYGLRETLYREAREKGVLFVRFDGAARPEVAISDGALTVRATDIGLGRPLTVAADLVVLSTGIRPSPSASEVAGALKVPIGKDGFFSEAHMKLRPLDVASDGLFLCGLAHGPKLLDESITQAQGAAARAATILSRDALPLSPEISVVDPDRCVGCLTCVRSCPFGVPRISDEKTAYIEEAACQGCGICAGACPRKAIDTCHATDAQMIAKVEALFGLDGDTP